MKIKGKGKKAPGINVMVSPAAHKKMSLDAIKAKPRRSIREQVNIINNLPQDE